MNQLTEKSKMAKTIRTKEGLEALRVDMIKSDALDKTMRISDYVDTYKMSSSIVQYLIHLNAVKDKDPSIGRASGKKLSWIYEGTPTGVVDSVLVEKVLDMQKKHEIDRRKEIYNKKKEDRIDEMLERKGLIELPTRPDAGVGKINQWLQEKLDKEAICPGFLRPDEKAMYNKIVETFIGLAELKQVMQKIHI